MRISKSLFYTAAMSAAVSGHNAASAQVATEADKAGGGTDIVVAAQRREERLQTTPIAVTALSSNMLEQRGPVRMENIAASAPTLFPYEPRVLRVGVRFKY